ncbi:MAG: membrane dipeptidase, partial [Planctomycetes bacterium]|nr:membrane dipeptidase [Planctomycetota bacterium]
RGYQEAYATAITKISAIRRLAETMYPDRCELALSPDDVERIVAGGKRAIAIGIENGYPIGTDLARVKKFHDLGVRYITLSHNGHNQICDSCNPSARLGDPGSRHGGLSGFGRQVVAEMNRLGIMVDVSHVSPETFWDVMAVSRAPVIASHSGCRALNDISRNLDDRQLKALAENGGVIQIVALDSFLKAIPPALGQAMNEAAKELGVPIGPDGPHYDAMTSDQYRQYRRRVQELNREHALAGIKEYVDHIDHAVEVAGIDHVGIGTDFDGGGGIPGFENHAEALNVTVELVRRGYVEDAIRKIWGGNLLRVWRKVQSEGRF